ncbi:MAG: aspartate carbamoyltransferase catalytic subunit [Alphaproteobacteria bacterium]|nr:aspartate carbamoyltransferase catalytic subunit [Alphaproteobacteria bacterium]
MSQGSEDKLLKLRAKRDLSFFDLHSVSQINDDDLALILDLARGFRDTKTEKLNFCKGCSLVHAFFEPSTRTLSSFDLSAKNISMDTNSVSSGSSVKKGESFLDTAQTLDAYNLSVITIRAAQAGVPEMLSRHVGAAVINAGDGWHEHPTQGLLDVLTMLDHLDNKDLKGKTVTIVGDILHSRVFGSLIRLLKQLKATVRIAAPETFLPAEVEKFGLTTHYRVEEALEGSDIVYALRVQKERGSGGFIPSLREYSKMFGITRARLDLANDNAILMHPGPVQRDIDVHSALVSLDSQSHILRQVENGMAVRKALLWLLSKRLDGKTKPYERL